jgi:malate synthase
VTPEDLLDIAATPGDVTLDGVHGNIEVGLRYLEAWLGGNGAVGIHNLMEDAATAEIARSQLWQWIRNGTETTTGEVVTEDLVRKILDEEYAEIRAESGAEEFGANRLADARALFEQVALSEEYVDFLTLPAYDLVVSELEA